MLGHDFLPFYTAGSLVREGRHRQLYDLDAVTAAERSTAADAGLELGDAMGPFWNPPFYALPFVPLSGLPYHAALAAWWALGLAALAASVVLLRRLLPEAARRDCRTWALIPLLLLISTPFLQALTHGQNTFFSLLLLTATVTFWRSRRPLLAGLTLGLLSYKPQLAALIALVLILDLGWRAAAGFAAVTGALLLTAAVALPGSLGDYLHRLPGMLHYMQVEQPYIWERHATLKAFWRLLLQGPAAGEPSAAVAILTGGCRAAVVLALGVAVVRVRRGDRDTSPLRRDRLVAAAVAATPLVMPFYFDYDLLLLAVPAVLLAGEFSDPALLPTAARPRADRWFVRLGVALFVWMIVNPDVAELTRVNLSVLLLSAAAAMLLARAIRAPVVTVANVANVDAAHGTTDRSALPLAA